MRVSLVTVTWHSSRWLNRLLTTLEGIDEVVVVDHSEDPAEAKRLRELPVQRLVEQPNAGYGAGLNRGVQEASGEVLLLVNPDVRFAPGAVEHLARLATQPGVGAAGPMLVWSEESPWQLPHSAHHTWFREWAAARMPRLARRLYLRQMDRAWRANSPAAVPVIGGAVMVTTRAVFAASGGFDERYFLFFEENDWCLRLRRQHLRLMVEPKATVFHDWGHAIRDTAARHHVRSLTLYRQEHFPTWYLAWFPAPPSPGDPPMAQAANPACRAGDQLLLVGSPLCIPAARLVAPRTVEDASQLVPAGLQPGRYHVVRRLGGRLERLTSLEVGPRGL